nr:MAG TPA: head to tail adaptor [Caudoviricetes sp.]
MENYLFGIPICTTDGRKLSAQAIKKQISAAQQRIETLFSIKLNRQVIEESKDFIRQEWNTWGYVKSTYPVAYPDNMKGFINDACQVNYPKEWLSIKKNENVAVWRNVHVIPNSSSDKGAEMSQHSIIYNGVYPHLGWFGKNYIPNYWRLKYITGWNADNIPEDLMDLINKIAAINVLCIIGSYLYGVAMSSLSVSLDGVSQNIPLTRGGKYGMFSDRIQMYMDDVNNIMENAKYIYKGLTFEVV